MGMTGHGKGPWNKPGAGSNGVSYVNYTSMQGYFLQDDPLTNASTFDYV